MKHSDVPVSVKIRLGFRSGEDVSFTMVDMAKELGLSFMAVHARYTSSTYNDPADWSRLEAVKRHAGDDLPIVGNGDVRQPSDIVSMIEQTGVDGVMIGQYNVGYASGETNTIPVFYGKDVRQWIMDPTPLVKNDRSRLVWRGETESGQEARLFRLSWENPRPDLQIAWLDFISHNTKAAPFLIAVTAD